MANLARRVFDLMDNYDVADFGGDVAEVEQTMNEAPMAVIEFLVSALEQSLIVCDIRHEQMR